MQIDIKFIHNGQIGRSFSYPNVLERTSYAYTTVKGRQKGRHIHTRTVKKCYATIPELSCADIVKKETIEGPQRSVFGYDSGTV